MTDEIKVGRLARDMFGTEVQVQREADKPTVLSFPVSSERPIERWFGTEILSHDPKAIRMDRMNSGAAPVLFNHDWNDPVGMVDRAYIKGDRLWVDAHFFETQRAKEVEQMVLGGMRNVSIGYELYQITEDTKRNTYTATDWGVLEVSWATVPADPGVGLGRSQADDAQPVRVVREVSQPAAAPAASSERQTMTVENNAAAGANAEQHQDVDYSKVDPVQEAARRREAIEKMARANGVSDQRTVEHWVRSGKSWDQIADDLLKIKAENSRSSAAYLDMPESDAKRYSLWRAMNAVLSGDWKHAGLELEASRAIAAKTQRASNAKGFFVPLDVQERAVQKRDLTVASASGGGYLVGTENMSFIDVLRNRSVAMRMGATRMPGLTGNVTVPKQTAGATAYWLSTEGTAITEGALTFGQMALSPKTVGAYVEVSRLLMLQSSPAAEAIVTSDLASQVALAADLAVLHGSGASGQPTGITATGSIGSVTGTSIAYAGVVEFQTDVAANNVMPARGGYVTTPAVAGLLKQRARFSNTDTPLWQGNIWDGQMEGFPAMSSNQVNSATMIFGDWSQVVIGEWGVLEVSLNEQANFPMGVVGFRAFYSMDVGVRYAGAFSVASSIT